MTMVANRPIQFDDSPEVDSLYELQLNPGLNSELLDYAEKFKYMTRGIMIVTGMPGSGKDLWGNTVSWLVKTIFKGKKVFRDEIPRRLFGNYEEFSEITVMNEFAQLSADLDDQMPSEIKRSDAKTAKKMVDLSNQWMAKIGEERLHNSVLFMTEFWRYMHNRKPFSPIGMLLGAIVKRWRHLDLLLIGNAQQKRELDAISCLPYITHEVRCSWGINNPNAGGYRLYPVKWVSSSGVLEVRGKSKKFRIDGKQPRDFLDGKGYFNLFNSKSFGSTYSGISKI